MRLTMEAEGEAFGYHVTDDMVEDLMVSVCALASLADDEYDFLAMLEDANTGTGVDIMDAAFMAGASIAIWCPDEGFRLFGSI